MQYITFRSNTFLQFKAVASSTAASSLILLYHKSNIFNVITRLEKEIVIFVALSCEIICSDYFTADNIVLMLS